MQINLYAQNKLSRIEAVNWFESLDKNTKHNTLTRLYWYIINTSPTIEEIDISIANSDLKKTYTPIVLILKDNNPLPRILELPENEYKKSFILLLEVFKKITYKMKMYILIKEDVPDKFAPVISAHASLACYKKFEEDSDMQKWVNGIFKKVVCKVNEKEFANAINEEKNLVITESALESKEVCVVFCPRNTYSKQFNYFKLWSPSI